MKGLVDLEATQWFWTRDPWNKNDVFYYNKGTQRSQNKEIIERNIVFVSPVKVCYK